MGLGIRTISVQLSARLGNYATTMLQAGQATRALSGELTTLAATSKSKFGQISKVTTSIGIGLVGGFLLAEKAALSFDKQMSAVNAVMDKTGLSTKQSAAQLIALREAAIKAGQKTAFTATQAAQAEEELLKAGISTKDILSGGLTGALNLASAGTISLGDAAKYAAQAMVEFNLQGKDVGHIADVLTAGANKSVTDVQGLGNALGQAGTVAHQAGLSLDETVGVLALFSQHGLDGVEAGTTFKQMLLKLEGPSAKASDLMKSLGLNVYDANGNFVSASQLAANLQKSLGGLSQANRNAALNTIFGSRAVRGAIDLYNAGAAGVQQWTANVNDSGIAAKTANAKLDNLAGDLKKLEGSLQALAITSSGGATTGLRLLSQGAETAVNDFSNLPRPLQETVSILTAVSGATLLVGTGFFKVKGSIATFRENLRGMGPAGEKAAGALGRVGGSLGKFGLYGIGILAAYEGVKTLVDYIDTNGDPVHANITRLTSDLQNFAETGRITGSMLKITGTSVTVFAEKLSASIAKYKTLLNAAQSAQQIAASNPNLSAGQVSAIQSANFQRAMQSTKNLLANVQDLDAGMAALVQSGDTRDAYVLFNQFSQALQGTGMSLGQVNSLFPQYDDAAMNAAYANGIATKSTNLLVTAQGTLALGLDDSISKGLALKDVLDSLSGANEDAEKSTIAAEQALADLTKALEKNKKAHEKNRTSLVASTQAGRDNLNQILGSIDADKNQFKTTFTKLSQTEDQTTALKGATDQYDAYIKRLRLALINEGFNKTQVDDLIAAYGKIPPVKSVLIQTPGMDKAITAAQTLAGWVFGLPSSKTIQIRLQAQENKVANQLSRFGVNNLRGGVYTHAATGALRNADTYRPVTRGALYAFAEPQTGGEAFVPKYGNYARSTQIIDQAARWYGGRFAPAGYGNGGGGGSSTYAPSITNNIYPQRADWTPQDYMAMQARTETMLRVGRPR